MIKFKEFYIKGLFGRSDVRIPISDNKIIIVGYNGVGKSTILNAFYYLISCQWRKLDEIIFEEIVLTTNKKKIRITKREISAQHRRRGRGFRGVNHYVAEIIKTWSAEEVKSFSSDPYRSKLEFLRSPLGRHLPSSAVREIQHAVREYLESPDVNQIDAENIINIRQYFEEELKGRILYLPTYRRIEKDIKAIFPEIEEAIQEAIQRKTKGLKGAEVFVELVNFGMEDVKNKINEKLQQLQYQALAEVSGLTTRYLRDVIRNEANTYSNDLARKIDQESLEGIFNKVDESILNKDDRDNINLVVSKIKNRKSLENNEKYVAHYVSYLIDIAERIKVYEAPVRSFVDICNSYLYGKRFVFDNIDYNFYIKYVSNSEKTSSENQDDIQMEDLSSGEKQIVSLFSHLTLESNSLNYIIIDEPELSLSVDWQQRFLSDISRTQGCAFLGAVTHSPFIFDNELEKHTVDIIQSMS